MHRQVRGQQCSGLRVPPEGQGGCLLACVPYKGGGIGASLGTRGLGKQCSPLHLPASLVSVLQHVHPRCIHATAMPACRLLPCCL